MQIVPKIQKPIHELKHHVGKLALSQHARPVGSLPSDTKK